LLDTDRDPTHEIHFEFGFNSDQPVTGDWNGDGIGDAGVARKSAGLLQWFLDTNRDPWADRTLNFGFNTDVPIVGDWDGDGRDEVGVVRNRRDWYLDVAGDGQYAERVVSFGLSGDVPMPGKWKPTSGASNGNQSQMVAAVPLSSFDLDNLLNGTNARLTELQSKVGAEGSSKQVLNKVFLDEVKKFKERKLEAQDKLRTVRRNLRQDIEHLGTLLFLVNTFMVPLALILGAIGFSALKKR